MTSEAATPEASGTPTQTPGLVPEHINHPVDGCPQPCCRIIFDHRLDYGHGITNPISVTYVWNWARGQWEAER
jgi:hypothetical protein